MKRRILDSGFCAPFFIWDDGSGQLRIIDGHQRRAALLALEADGYDIPPLPVDYIHAETEEEAREILLSVSSQYGEWVEDELKEWMDGIDVSIEDTLRFAGEEVEIIKVNNIGEIKNRVKHKKIEPYKKVHILLSMSQDTFFDLQETLKQIKTNDGVEYEQGQN